MKTFRHQSNIVKRIHYLNDLLQEPIEIIPTEISENDELLEELSTSLEAITNIFPEMEFQRYLVRRTINRIQQLLHDGRQHRLQRIHEEISGLKEIFKILRFRVMTVKRNIVDLEIHTKYHQPNGMMIFKIDNFKEKFQDACSQRRQSIYSTEFFTSNEGYRLSLRIYLNGDGSARDQSLSVFLVIMRGPFDAILRWPFEYRVAFCLWNQKTQKADYVESFRPNPETSSFQRPFLKMNSASGIPTFVSVEKIRSPENPYVVDDVMFIKVFVNFFDVPFEMLKFVFELDSSLPLPIQDRLILDELKRHPEIKKMNAPLLNK